MPTLAELCELPYAGSSAFAQGILASDFEREYLIAGIGIQIRWFKGLQVPPGTAGRDRNGRRYEEQLTCADGTTLVSAARVMLYRTREDIEDADFGLLPAGSTAISTLPDKIPLARLDRVIIPAGKGYWIRREVKRAASGDDAIFPADVIATPVRSIKRVWQGVTAYTLSTHYTLVGNAVRWLSGGPAVGSTYGVEVTYSPIYTALGNDMQPPHIDATGAQLPQILPLKREYPGQM